MAVPHRKRTLLILASSKIQGEYFGDCISKILGDILDIQLQVCREKSEVAEPSYIPFEGIVLAIGSQSQTFAKKHFQTSDVVLATLDVRGTGFLNGLLQLPSGKQVIFVHRSKDSAEQAIQSLIDQGIDHITYVPYWPGCNTDIHGIDTAIYTMSSEECPAEIKNRINLGFRNLSMSTFIEILGKFNLSMNYADQYLKIQRQESVQDFRSSANTSNFPLIYLNDITQIANASGLGLLLTDHLGKIAIFNQQAQDLLKLSSSQWLGKDISILFDRFPHLFSSIGNSKKESIETVNGKTTSLSVVPLDNNSFRCAYLFRPYKANKSTTAKTKGKEYSARYTFEDMIAESPSIVQLISHSRMLAATELPLLITGESGTGKEVFAQSIHNASRRAIGPFIPVNFAALPENLVESELFGYEEGAFTGAKKTGHKGLFELANGGTMFLDEIGDASMSVQQRLLRVLEEKEVMRLGGNTFYPVDIRIIAATNQNLESKIEQGKFREDLYYRLRGFPLELPALRNHKESLPRIIEQYLLRAGSPKHFSAEAMSCIMKYPWYGNMRELKNMMDYLICLVEKDVVEEQDLPDYLRTYSPPPTKGVASTYVGSFTSQKDIQENQLLKALAYLETHGKNNGRGALASALHQQGIAITESEVRTLLKSLKAKGYISSGTTRQGSHLTESGQRYLMQTNNVQSMGSND